MLAPEALIGLIKKESTRYIQFAVSLDVFNAQRLPQPCACTAPSLARSLFASLLRAQSGRHKHAGWNAWNACSCCCCSCPPVAAAPPAPPSLLLQLPLPPLQLLLLLGSSAAPPRSLDARNGPSRLCSREAGDKLGQQLAHYTNNTTTATTTTSSSSSTTASNPPPARPSRRPPPNRASQAHSEALLSLPAAPCSCAANTPRINET